MTGRNMFYFRDIQLLEKRIVTEWLPSSGYEYDNGPDIEVYLTHDPKHAKYEVWIPVVKNRRCGKQPLLCSDYLLFYTSTMK
ncbi:MAG: GyrI-like domain-containing protein [Treponema sp.]